MTSAPRGAALKVELAADCGHVAQAGSLASAMKRSISCVHEQHSSADETVADIASCAGGQLDLTPAYGPAV